MALIIKVNGKSLVMDPAAKLRFEINSPLFETDAIPGSYICPFDLPVTGNDIFDNAEFIEINKIYKKYDCIVYFDNLPFFSGQLILNVSNPNKYRCSVILTGIDINFPAKKLNTLDCGEDIVIGGTPHSSANVIAYAKAQNNLTETDLVFPVIHCPNFYGSSDETADSPANADYGKPIINAGEYTGKLLNNWNAITQNFGVNAMRNEDNSTAVDNTFVMSPQLKLYFVIKKIFESIGYACTGDFFNDAFVNKLLFLNYYAIDNKIKNYFVQAKSTLPYYSTTIYKVILDDVSSLGCEDLDNCFNVTTYSYEMKHVGSHNIKFRVNAKAETTQNFNQILWRWVYLVDTYGNESLLATESISDGYLQSTYGLFTIEADYYCYALNVGAKIIIKLGAYGDYQWNTPHTINNAYLTVTNASYQNLNVFANSIHIANHMTANLVGDVLNTIKVNFGLAMWFDAEKKEIEISFVKDVLKSYRSIDISNVVVRNSMEISFKDAPGYWLTQKSDSQVNDISLLTNIGSFLKLTDLPVPDKLNVIAEVLTEGCFYIYKKNDSDFSLSWVRYGTSVREIKKDIVIDTASTNVTVAIGVGVMTNTIYNNMLLPDSNQIGTSPSFDTGINDTDMQILIWYGMTADKNNHLYPSASALRYDIAGNIINNSELRLDGENGIYKKYLQSWYDFMNTAGPVSLQMKLKSTDVISLLQLFKPQMNKATQQIRKIKYNGSVLLPKTFSFIVPVQGEYIEAQIDSYKAGGVEL